MSVKLPASVFEQQYTPNPSPMILYLLEHIQEQETSILEKLVTKYNNKELTEQEALLAVSEIATLRNLMKTLIKE